MWNILVTVLLAEIKLAHMWVTKDTSPFGRRTFLGLEVCTIIDLLRRLESDTMWFVAPISIIHSCEPFETNNVVSVLVAFAVESILAVGAEAPPLLSS